MLRSEEAVRKIAGYPTWQGEVELVAMFLGHGRHDIVDVFLD